MADVVSLAEPERPETRAVGDLGITMEMMFDQMADDQRLLRAALWEIMELRLALGMNPYFTAPHPDAALAAPQDAAPGVVDG